MLRIRARGLDRRLQVLTTPGVHMILSRGERIATIPEDEIEAIRKTIEGPFRVEPHPFLRCGERVRVVRGSLEGVEGVLIRKKNLYRLVLSVEMLAQSVAVEDQRGGCNSGSRARLGRRISRSPAETNEGLYESLRSVCGRGLMDRQSVGW